MAQAADSAVCPFLIGVSGLGDSLSATLGIEVGLAVQLREEIPAHMWAVLGTRDTVTAAWEGWTQFLLQYT